VTISPVEIRRDLIYRQVEGFRPLSLDLYLPSDLPPRAVCVYLHGGGWRVGSRRAGPGPLGPTSGRLFERMATAGLAVASTDYRLSGEAQFPSQLADVHAAIDWLHTYDMTTGLPLVLFGVSAGGHLACLGALHRPTPVVAVAAWYPPTDLLAMPSDLLLSRSDLFDVESREAKLLGAPAASVPQLAQAASPVFQVHASAPPFLLMHGDADSLVPYQQSKRFHEALVGAGSVSVLRPVLGYDHMFRGMPDAEVEALVDETVAFLLSYLD
jgi:acetyl esterase/lipase